MSPPMYEYQCKECGKQIEVTQKFSDEPLKECSECKGELKRVISAPAVRHYLAKGTSQGKPQAHFLHSFSV